MSYSWKGLFDLLILVFAGILLAGWFGVRYLPNGSQKGGAYAINESFPTSTTTDIKYSDTLPDGATIKDVGNGLKTYTNPKYKLSFNFPSSENVFLIVRSTSAYSLDLSKGNPSTRHKLSIALYDQNDSVSTERGKPLPRPSTGTSTFIGGQEFIFSDNVAFAQQYHSTSFFTRATSGGLIKVVPENSYSLELNYDFTDPNDLQKKSALIEQIVNSISFSK